MGNEKKKKTMPRIFNTKSYRRGTAWQATTASTMPTSPSPGKARSDVSSDPAFEYDEDESQKMINSINIRKLSSMTSAKECLDIEPNSATMDETAIKPFHPTNEITKDQSSEYGTSENVESLKTRVVELEKELKDHQIIKTMERELNEMKQDRVSLKNRLAQIEYSISNVVRGRDELKKEFSEQKKMLASSVQATESRFLSLEKQMVEGQEAFKQSSNERKRLAAVSSNQQKAVCVLTDRLEASEQQIAQLQTTLQLQSKIATGERETFKKYLESFEKIIKDKNNRIYNLEGYLQDSAKEAKQLKSLLTRTRNSLSRKVLKNDC